MRTIIKNLLIRFIRAPRVYICWTLQSDCLRLHAYIVWDEQYLYECNSYNGLALGTSGSREGGKAPRCRLYVLDNPENSWNIPCALTFWGNERALATRTLMQKGKFSIGWPCRSGVSRLRPRPALIVVGRLIRSHELILGSVSRLKGRNVELSVCRETSYVPIRAHT